MAKKGASLSIDATMFATATVENIAQLCVTNGGKITIRNASAMDKSTLEAIARFGKTSVTLEV
ncbi:MAG: hypothetical protein QM790_17525 [Nibricoccus sp.]